MSVIPSWAPNLHPLVIHFPIVLLITAAVVDLLDLAPQCPRWLNRAATSLYVASAVAAVATYLTGVQAGSSVLVPGMAYPVLTAHRAWGLTTMWFCVVLAVVRVGVLRTSTARTLPGRMLLLAAGLVGVFLLQQTAERGARLVYEFGTGVMSMPGQR